MRWAAGFMVGHCLDGSGRKIAVLGHGAPGGTVGLCLPDAGLALASTVSKLSPSRTATRKGLDLLLSEHGLKLPPGGIAGLTVDA